MAARFIHGLDQLEVLPKGWVLTIGSFDGVHLGHQAVLQQVLQLAKQYQLPSMVMVFEPQPHEYFSREAAPARLMRLREKVAALMDAGVDAVVCLKFDSRLRSLSAQHYVEKVLVNGIGVKHLVIGDDFRFGCDRKGDFQLLKRSGEHYGFSVRDTATLEHGNERISSTRIRTLLEQDQLEHAKNLLGRAFGICGRVVYGKQLGRTLGFPTANIGLGRYRSPVQGVYAVALELDGSVFKSVANVGVRPTVGGRRTPVLEVHILDFDKDIYSCFVHVKFLKKLREEKEFDSLTELKTQIAKDLDTALSYFSETSG